MEKKIHSSKVTGMAIHDKNILISISEDKTLKIFDVDKKITLKEIILGNFPLNCLNYDPIYERLFITNKNSSIFILKIILVI